MKKQICLLVIMMLITTSCGGQKQLESDDKESKTDVEEIAEDTQDQVKEEIVNVLDDFNDFVEVSFEHKEYPSIDDGKPDYSGIYCIDNYSTTYGCCNIIKQEDGSYYCSVYEARAFNYEVKADNKSGNILENETGLCNRKLKLENSVPYKV
ncbi:hypothetical protein SAMN02910298_02396 [Pseudobutyrivibrio sp. YE44]|uniref:hypothetical protein n=1 Tax=Pseudobutyrivibrio sp. YE44 TaxID=1520802 RepID=UPI00087FB7E7|nr:hypothetical protein [Pseudobutyrivibrio sp. YE44]SDB47847.1 hypothetical protein SAMN02910298_02396 [Pseudobutyrivibrio sp. YE44]